MYKYLIYEIWLMLKTKKGSFSYLPIIVTYVFTININSYTPIKTLKVRYSS